MCPLTHTYAPGMAFLAFGSEQRLRHYEEFAATADGRKGLGLTDAPDEHFREEIERVRKQRFVWRRQSGAPGVGRVSVPVFGLSSEPARVIAVLGIACSGRLLTIEQATHWGLLLRQNAGRLERVLRDGHSQEAYLRWTETSVFGDRP
jgi:DNA-binding IclR family transcriptional regulator